MSNVILRRLFLLGVVVLLAIGAAGGDFTCPSIEISPYEPVVTIIHPEHDAEFEESETIALIAQVENMYGQAPMLVTVTWFSDLDGELGSGTCDENWESQLEVSSLSLGMHRITALAQNPGGIMSAQSTIEISIEMPKLDQMVVLPLEMLISVGQVYSSFSIYNSGTTSFSWTALEDLDSMTLSHTSGSLSTGESVQVGMSIDRTVISHNEVGTIEIEAGEAGSAEIGVTVSYGSDWYDDYDFASKGVIGYWPFDCDTSDYSGNDDHGAPYGVTCTSGAFGQAYLFDGTDDFVDCGIPSYAPGSLSISAWIKAEGDDTTLPLVSRTRYANGNGSDDPFMAAILGDSSSEGPGTPIMVIDGSDSQDDKVAGSQNLLDNSWHHLAFTYDQDTRHMALYVDGILENSASGPSGIVDWAGVPLYIGASVLATGGPEDVFKGIIDEVVMFDRALSDSEAAALVSDDDADGIADFWSENTPVRIPVFVDQAGSRGVAHSGSGNDAVCIDYDNDGDLDLYVTNGPGSSVFYRNTGNGSFENITGAVGLSNRGNRLQAIDYDNDGWMDLFASDWSQDGYVKLYRNTGNGTFEGTTDSSGLSALSEGSGAAWGDYDGDGFVDIYLSSEGRLFRNNRDGTFDEATDVAFDFSLPLLSASEFIDYDQDGYADLFLAPSQGTFALLRSIGDGTFEDVSVIAEINIASDRGELAIGDYNGDGYPDIFVLGGGPGNFLFSNNGDGTFTEIADSAGVKATPGTGRSEAAFADFDQDGDQDLFANGGRYGSNAFFRNDGGTFTDITHLTGLSNTDDTHGIAVGDFNGDDLPDIYEVNFTGYGSSTNRLFVNGASSGEGESEGEAEGEGEGEGE
ncbi:FG-GAP-like repeat-containing protein [Candidatus Hydrogenedentota bacterium]